MLDANDLEIIESFIEEGLELIDEVEPRLVELSLLQDTTGAVDMEMINSIFRLFHSMKGSAGVLELKNIVDLTHKTENLLDLFRKGLAELETNDVQLLLKSIDLLRDLLNILAKTNDDCGREVEVEEHGARLLASITAKQAGGKPATDAIAVSPSEPPAAAVEQPNSQPQPAAAIPASAEPAGSEAADAATEIVDTWGELEPESEPSDETNAEIKAEAEPPPVGGDEKFEIMITPEMRDRFTEEAEELLEAAEQVMLHLTENGQAEEQQLTDAMRSFHSFKGNSGFMGFADLEHLTHACESLLEQVVDGAIPGDQTMANLVLEVIDTLRAAIRNLSLGGKGEVDNLEDLLTRLKSLTTPPSPVVEKRTSGLLILDPTAMKKPAAQPEPKPAATATENVTPVGPPEPVTPPAVEPLAAAAPPSAVAMPETKPVPEPAAAPTAAPPAAAAKIPAVKGTAADQPSGENTKSPAAKSIRVDLNKLDSLLNLVGELVIAETMVTRNPDLLGKEFENFEKASHHLRRITSDLQDVAMSVRMIPLAGTFRRMIRLVHDTSNKAGKKAKLNLIGEETEMDKTVIEQITDPLVHIVRNAIDHGLEPAEERITLGKPETGTVTIEAKHESGEVWIVISDDGRGLDREKILAKARERGLVEGDGSDLRDEDVYKLVFEPGFSLAKAVTEISGRGVGMDVVKKNLERLNGRVDIRSQMGKGSSMVLRIPLTLAIIEGMMVRVGPARYSIPMLSIREALRVDSAMITNTPEGDELVRVREEMIPVFRLHDAYNIEPDSRELPEGILIIVDTESGTAALFVDEILGQQQTVVKGLSDYVGTPRGVSGCTILGDGRVSLILDVGNLLANKQHLVAVGG
ncbi:MAG: chemotaxis protein CheA [bacterium]